MPRNPNLTGPEFITTSASLLLYIEKKGPFARTAPIAWKDFRRLTRNKLDPQITLEHVSLNLIDRTKKGDAAYLYQAGVLVSQEPATIPIGIEFRTLAPAVYARFVLQGSYAQLPTAYPEMFDILDDNGIERANHFCIERYTRDAEGTPIEDLLTEILIPIH